MESLKRLLLGLVLHSVNSDFWDIKYLDNFITLKIESLVNSRSSLSCVAHCASVADNLIEMATIKDGLCYCLNPKPNIFNDLTTPTVFALSRESVCSYKGYDILAELGICIKYSTITDNWSNAQNNCNQDGGYLVNLNTVEKVTTIFNMSLAYNIDLIHIGGYRFNSTTWFNWTRGAVVGDQFWADNEPSPQVHENCMAIYKKIDTPEFGNLPCTYQRPYLCELLL